MATTLLAAPAVARADGFVHRSGTTMVDGDGNRIWLRGVGLGNWLMWENFMMGGPFTSNAGEKAIVANLTTLVGADRARQFQADVYANYTRQADIQQIAALGYNVLRVPINHTILEDDSAPGVYEDAGFQRLDDVVAWARTAGLYVVLDLHSAPGGQSGGFIADPDAPGQRMFDTAANKARTIALWQAIARHFRDEPAIAGYDLLNEPAPPSNAALISFYTQLTTAIRGVDPNHMLMYEGNRYARDNYMFTSRLDENMALTIHQYLWGTATAESDVKGATADARRLDVPLWVGEMGLDSPANLENRVARFDGDPLISGWAAWPWKTAALGYGRRTLVEFTPTTAWRKTINWLANPRATQAKPTPDEAEQGLNDYVGLIRGTTPDREIAAALRPPGGAQAADEGTGLTGHYFTDRRFTTPAFVRVDPKIDFNWYYGSPGKAIPSDNFSVRWQGAVEAVSTGPATFTTTVDDGVRVWVGGALVIDDTVATGRHSRSATVDMVAGTRYPIGRGYLEQTLSASVKLEWQPAGGSRAVVPTAVLRPAV